MMLRLPLGKLCYIYGCLLFPLCCSSYFSVAGVMRRKYIYNLALNELVNNKVKCEKPHNGECNANGDKVFPKRLIVR